FGFLEIGAEVLEGRPGSSVPTEVRAPVPLDREGLEEMMPTSGAVPLAERAIRYQSNSPTYEAFPRWVERVGNEEIQKQRCAAALMQGVVEEKMQRIAEVLLGSVQPFGLMLGKLIGTVGVSLTLAAVYLGSGYSAAQQYGFADYLSVEVLVWFIVFQILGVLM